MNFKNISHFRISITIVAVIVTILIGASLYYEIQRIKTHVVETALLQADEYFFKDVQYRKWNASHGGVYVELNDSVAPNPYLNVPNRDITVQSGRKYTLMNPAWMTREAYEQFGLNNDVRAHITSLNPLNPQNAADPWERLALKQMINKDSRIFSTEMLNGENYLRMMRPFVTEKSCLKCHSEQGYKEGDIRGGICISIRLQPIKNTEEANLVSLSLIHGIVWITLMGGLYFWGLSHRKERKKLKESEVRWHFALENAGDGVWDWNAVTNEVFYSTQWKAMLGYEEAEIGDTLEEWSGRVHPEDIKQCLEKVEQHLKNETPIYVSEHRIKCKDGSYKWVLDRGKVIEWTKDGKPKRVIGIHSDISERKINEAKIKESEIFLQGILEATNDGILAVDNNGRVIKSNNRFMEMWNIPNELMDKKDDHALLQHIQEQVLNPEEFISGIQVLYNSERSNLDSVLFKNGRVFERYSTALKIGNDIVGRVWSFRDISENKKAYEQLRDSERLLKQSQEVSKIGSYVLDITAGEWHGSEVLNDMFGISKSDGHSINDWISVIHPEDRDTMSEYFSNEVVGKKNRFDKEYRIQRINNGHVCWVHGIGELEFDSTGAPIKMIGTIQDITEKKIISEEIVQRKIQLETLIENLPGYMYRANDVADKPQLLFVSKGVLDITGYRSEELIHNDSINFVDLIHSEDLAKCWGETQAGIDKKISFEIEYRISTKSGKEKWLWERGKGIYDVHGKYLYTEGYVVDITERKHAEQIVINSETKFRLVWENSLDAMRLADENGIMVMVNKAFCDLVGKSENDLVGSSVTSIHSIDPEKMIQGYTHNFKKRKDIPPYQGDIRLWNGITIYVEVAHTFLSTPEKPLLLLSVFHDITVRKKALQELENEKSLLRTVIENIPDAIYVKDLQGKKILANIADAQYAGKQTVEEVIGKTDADLYSEDIAAHSRYEEEEILRTGISMKNYEGNFLSLSGERRWLIGNKILLKDETGKNTGILGINHDITERKLAEEKNRMLAHTIESISEAVTITDLEDKLIYVNKAFSQIFGYTRDEVIGKHIEMLWSKNNVDGVDIELIKATNSGGWKGELLNNSKDGREFPIELSTSQVKNERGEIVALVGVAEDITNKKKTERQIIESEKHLRRAEDVALIGNWKLTVHDNIVHVSDGAKNIFGHEHNQISLWNFYKFSLRESRPSLVTSFRKMITEKIPLEVEFKIKRTSDGSTRDIYMKSESEPGTENIFGIIHDITRQKKLELLARARDAENRFLAESLLNLSECQTEDEVFSIIDLSLRLQFPESISFISRFSDNPDYCKLMTLNGVDDSKLSSAISKLGFDPRDIDLKVSSLFRENYCKPVLHKFDNGLKGFVADALPDNVVRELEQEFDIADVYTIGISQETIDYGFINIFTTNKYNRINTSIVKSLTHQCALALSKIRSLKLVLESEEKYRSLVEGSPDAIAVYVEGKVVYVNQASLRLMRATSANQLMGKTIVDFVHPAYREFVVQRMKKSMVDGKDLPLAEERFIRLDGTDVDVEVKAIPIKYQQKSGVQLIIRDITERKKAIEAISASEVFVKDILNSLTESIAVLDENGKIMEVNTSWKEFGRCNDYDSKTSGIGTNYYDVCKRAMLTRADSYAEQAFNGITAVAKQELHYFAMEYPCHSASEQRWFLMRVSPMTSPRKGIVISHEDISDRKRSQELLLARLRISDFAKENSLLDLLQKTIDEAELLTGSTIGFLHFVEPDQENLTLQAWSSNTLATMCTAEASGFHYPISKAGVWVDCIADRKPVIHNDYDTLPHKKGMPEGHALVKRELIVPIIRNHKVAALLGIGNKKSLYNDNDIRIIEQLANLAWDIILRKKAEDAFIESERRWRYALEGAGDAVWEWDFVNNTVFRSSRWKEMLGYSDEEISNELSELERLVHPEDLIKLKEALETNGTGESDSFSLEYRLRCKNGDYKWVLDRGKTMLKQANNKPSRIIGTHTDITPLKMIQYQIKELNEHLEEKVEERTRQLQETNRQLETFSYSVSHDLRSPLRAIDSFSRILLEEEMEHISENGKRQVSLIRGNTLRMSRLIDDLLEFSRTNRSELKRMPFDIGLLAKKIIAEFASADPGRVIESHIQTIPKIFGDPSLFRQVFVNLIGNALKFSKHRETSTIEIGGFESESETTVFIKDNGAGFDMRYADKLFGVFQRLHTESEYEGTGVGLAIVQRIIQRHGGTIRAQAALDKGATFTFTIPKQVTS